MAKKKINITPLGDRVVLQTSVPEQTTASGIIIPDTVSKEKPEQGTVVAVGEGKVLDSGKVVPVSVKVGDTVLFSKYAPDEVEVDGEKYLLVREDSLLAVIGK